MSTHGSQRPTRILGCLCAAVVLAASASGGQLSDDQVAELEEDLLFAEGEERAALVKKILGLRDARTQTALMKALLAEQPLAADLQEQVFNFLAEAADKRILPDIVEMVRAEGPQLRRYGLVLLGRMRDERAVDTLIAESQSSRNTDQMHVSIVRSLGRNAHRKAVPVLERMAADRPALAEEVTIARFQVGDVAAFSAFFELYQAKADVLSETAWEYGFRTGTAAEVRRLKKDKQALESYLHRMERALNDTHSDAVPALIQHADGKRDPKIYNLLFCSLPGLVRPDNAEHFLALLDCPSPEVAHMAIARMDSVGAAELRKEIDRRLLAMLKDGDVYARRLVLENAHRFGSEKGREVLEAGLHDKSPWVREKAAEEVRKWRLRP